MGKKRANNLYDKLIYWIRNYPKVLMNGSNWVRILSKELFCELRSYNDTITEFLDDIQDEMKDEWDLQNNSFNCNVLSRPQLEDKSIRYRNISCKLEHILDKNIDKISDWELRNKFYKLQQDIKNLEEMYYGK